MSYNCRKVDRFAESEFWADYTFWHKSGFCWQNFAMTSPGTLHMKITVNKLSFLLVTHTAYFDTRFGSHGLLKSGYSAEQILDRLDIQVNDQVLGHKKCKTCWGFNTVSVDNMLSFPLPTHIHVFDNYSNGYGHLNTAHHSEFGVSLKIGLVSGFDYLPRFGQQ
jgi:hypothetical protein